MSGADYCIDASAIIFAWYEGYPKDVFPSLWSQLAEHRTNMALIKPIYDQIDPISQADKVKSALENRKKHPLRMWMADNGFKSIGIDEEVEELSLLLEEEYQVREKSGGADGKDIKLIAYAKINNKIVVTEEGEQPQKPIKKYRYKIPLICDEKEVECINCIKMIRRLGIRI